ncbi:MAG: 50S ribosomal protein L11 methyltransferase [Deltaproteobacteria bacterium]|nr:50S ribosomal protein L11 methyltransferase [Deltaproteobacteria bacterium]MBW2053055.1 50S ribosomal protein L11 methyltransferase [Deltaproteobacteria bacterium]MBW2323602.1 50S ribosomal protein L11 methyltransferase [Deltaproteobacteria bacterium]
MPATGENKSKTWAEVSIKHPSELTEAVSNFFFEKGAQAVVHEDSSGLVLSKAGFGSSGPSAGLKDEINAFLKDLADIFGLTSLLKAEWSSVSYGDWAEKWKQDLDPIEVGSTLVIKPTWREYQAGPDRVVLSLDPGLAFGTGHHASTFLCLEGVEEYLSQPGHADARVLDVGTGSGILSMAAAALGRGRIVALDIDPDTLPVAAGNFSLNNQADRVFLLCADPAAISGRFDLILANLHRDALIRLASTLVNLGAPGARWILSGMLDEQAEEVAERFISVGLSLTHRAVKGEWVALIMEKREEP